MPVVKHNLSKHPLFTIWWNMQQRCYNPKNINYKNYGGRGVVVCKEWRGSFISFYQWCIANGWRKGLHLDKDKIGSGKRYSPNNCVIMTNLENAKYKRSNFFILFNGETKHLKEWCRDIGLNYKITHQRINRDKWSIKDALDPKLNNTGKKRQGEMCGVSKLTSKKVMIIFNSNKPGAFFCKKYSVSPMTISAIRTGRNWCHITRKIKK